MDPFCFLRFTFCLYNAVLYVLCIPVITCWKEADLLALLCVIFVCVFVTFPYCVSGQGRYFFEKFFQEYNRSAKQFGSKLLTNGMSRRH